MKKRILRRILITLFAVSFSAVLPVFASEAEDPVSTEGYKGGYIAMPWDKNVPAVDDDLSIRDIDEMIEGEALPVDESDSDGNEPQIVKAVRIDEDRDNILGSLSVDYDHSDTTAPEAYPAAYDDLDTINAHLNRLPDTRNQDPYGTCWAHSATCLTELYSILKLGMNKSDADFSERQLANYTFYSYKNNLNKNNVELVPNTGDSITISSEYNVLEHGCNLVDVIRSLMKWRGVVKESEAPYPAKENNTPVPAMSFDSTALEYDKDVARLENGYVINVHKNPSIVKNYIKEYGGAAISFYAATGAGYKNYYNGATNAYCYTSKREIDHAVTLVGWDDNYPKSRFNGARIEGDGAWLARNSWDAGVNSLQNDNDGRAEDGGYCTYFWISYYDKTFLDGVYVFKMQDSDAWLDNYYYYDSQFSSGLNVLSTRKMRAANVFTANGATDNEMLRAVTLQSLRADNNVADEEDVKCLIEIYTGVSDEGRPDSGTLASKEEVTLPFSGLYTVRLDEPVKLSHGEKYSIVTTLGDGKKTLDFEYPDNTDSTITRVTVKCGAKGQSLYINEGDSAWTDNYDKGFGNFCIGAVTDDIDANCVVKDLTAVYTGESGVQLSWSAAEGAEGYRVYKSETKDGEYSKIGEDVSGTSFTDTAFTSGVNKYYYRVFRLKKNKAGVLQVDLNSASDVADVKIGKLSAEQFTFTGETAVYDGKAHSASINPTVDGVGEITVYYCRNTESTWTTDAPVIPGTYKVKIDVAESDDYKAAAGLTDESWKITITTASIEKAVVTFTKESYEYSGAEIIPVLSDFDVMLGDNVLTPGTDYELLSYGNNNDIGTGNVTIGGKGYYEGEASGTFAITAKKYTVLCHDGEEVYESEVYYGGSYGDLITPEAAGYDFNGWYTEESGGDRIDSNTYVKDQPFLDLYARWKAKVFKVTLNANGGICSKESITVKYGSTYSTLPEPSKEGYLFDGWFTGNSRNAKEIKKTDTVDITEDTTLIALYTRIIDVSRITLDKKTATLIPGQSISLNAAVQPSNATFKELTWISDDDSVATVDESGRVTAVKEGSTVIKVISADEKRSAECSISVVTKVSEEYSGATGRKTTVIHDLITDKYLTANGEDVFMISDKNGAEVKTGGYQFTSKKIRPGKGTYVVFNGILYADKTDYSIHYKRNKKIGTSTATIKWKNHSIPRDEGILKTKVTFEIKPREVTSGMINARAKNYRLRRLTVTADGVNMKPGKNDYTYALSENGIVIDFKNNYSGSVFMRYDPDWGMLLP